MISQDNLPGELTLHGAQQMRSLGNELRKKYIQQLHLVHPTYQKQDLYVRSSDVDRCLMSAQHLLQGLYPTSSTSPSTTLLPPVHTVPQSEEYLLKGYEHCHRYRDYVQSTLNSDNVRLSLIADTPLFHKMSLLTGIEVTVKNVKPITDTIIILDEFAKELAASTTTKASYPVRNGAGFKQQNATTLTDKDMQRIVELHDTMNYITKSSRPMSRLMVGNLLRELLNNIAQYISGTKNAVGHGVPKLMIYSGHDTTVMGLLAAFGAVDAHGKSTPPTGSHIEIELLELVPIGAIPTHDYYVRIAYNGRVLRLPVCGTADLCPLGKVAEYLSAVVPLTLVKWSLECANTRQDISSSGGGGGGGGGGGDESSDMDKSRMSEEEQLFENGYLGLDWDAWSTMAILLSVILVMMNVMFDHIVIQYLFGLSRFNKLQSLPTRDSPNSTPQRSSGGGGSSGRSDSPAWWSDGKRKKDQNQDSGGGGGGGGGGATTCCFGMSRRSIVCGVASGCFMAMCFIFLVAFGVDWDEWPTLCFVIASLITVEGTCIVGVTMYTNCLKPLDEFGRYGQVPSDDYDEWGEGGGISDTL